MVMSLIRNRWRDNHWTRWHVWGPYDFAAVSTYSHSPISWTLISRSYFKLQGSMQYECVFYPESIEKTPIYINKLFLLGDLLNITKRDVFRYCIRLAYAETKFHIQWCRSFQDPSSLYLPYSVPKIHESLLQS